MSCTLNRCCSELTLVRRLFFPGTLHMRELEGRCCIWVFWYNPYTMIFIQMQKELFHCLRGTQILSSIESGFSPDSFAHGYSEGRSYSREYSSSRSYLEVRQIICPWVYLLNSVFTLLYWAVLPPNFFAIVADTLFDYVTVLLPCCWAWHREMTNLSAVYMSRSD